MEQQYETGIIWLQRRLRYLLRNVVYMNEFIGQHGSMRAGTNAYIPGGEKSVGADIFERGLCLPSDNKMTPDQQDRIIEVIRACFE